MDSFPLVSVIIATYNRADYLKLTIESIINQTYNNIEIIVVDDGSPNNEAEILCGNYSKVTYHKIENSGGPCKPRNIGIDHAKGKYIGFVDDDDIWLPEKVEIQVKILETNREFGLVHCYCNLIDENGGHLNGSIGRPRYATDKHGDVKLKMIGNWTLMMPTPLIDKKIIDEVGYFNTNMPQTAADVEYWTRCSFHTKFYYLDKCLVLYRKHSDNMSSNPKPYVHVPLHLKKVLISKYAEGRISSKQYNLLLQNVCYMQAKHVKKYPFKTIFNLFKLNPFWIVNFRIIKVIIKRLTT